MVEPIDVWAEIGKLEGQTIRTLEFQRAFELVRVEPKKVVVRIQRTGKQWSIRAGDIEGAFQALVREGHISRCDIEARFTQRGPAYVAAILARLPDVSFTLKPIRLWYRSERQASLL